MFKFNLAYFLLLFLSISINAQKTDLEIRKLKGAVKKVENYLSDNKLSSIDFYSKKGMLEKRISYDYDSETEKLLSIDSTLNNYNKNNRLIKKITFDTKGIYTVVNYFNNKGLLIKNVHTKGDSKPRIKKYSYNKVGKTTLVYDTQRGRANRKITEYDAKNRKTKVIYQVGDGEDISKPDYIEKYSHDDIKNIVAYNKYSPRYKNSYLDKKIFKYDKNNHLIEKVLYKPQRLFDVINNNDTLITNPKKPMAIVKYIYNKNETLRSVKVFDENKKVVERYSNEYDNQKRLVKKTKTENKETFIETTKYDGFDNIIAFAAYKKTLKSKPIYFRTYRFNEKGQVTEETNIVDGNKIIKKTFYDKFGNTTRRVHSKKDKVILTNHIKKYYYYK